MPCSYNGLPNSSCIFKQDFSGPVSVAKAGGNLVGAPSFVGGGVSLDGVSDYIQYAISNTLLSHPQMTIVMGFMPDFNWDDGIDHFFVDTTSGERVAVYKAAGGNFTVYINGVTVLNSIGVSEYGQYWKQSNLNVVVIVTTPGENRLYLNGYNVDTTTTSFTSSEPTELYLGASYSGASYFDGTIKNFSIHNRIFTQEDVSALQNNSLYNYANKADVWLDFKSLSDDLVLDRSGNGKNGTVDGCLFSAPGIFFDGVNDKLDQTLSDPTGTFTVAYKKRNEAAEFESDLTTWNQIKSAGSFSGTLDYLAVFPFELSPIQEEHLSVMWSGARD